MTCSPRILVVDDNESGRYALARYLRFAGFTVEEVGTGAACFRCASASECDLVLLDIHLPDISGTEVCRQLKAHPKTADIPVIQISAMFTHSHDRIVGLESGADAYLTAPFEPREVMAQVQALLRARRAEAALRKSEQQYRLLFDKNPDAVLSLDPSGRFTLTNPACEEILGYTAAELLEKTFMELCAPERAAEARAHFKRALQGFDFSGLLTTIIKKDGSRAELLISGQPILEDKNQSVVAVYCTARDVTSINRAQAARRELQRKVNSALLAGEVGMFEWLVEEDRLWGDRNFTRLFGIGSEHASLPLAEYLKVIHPDDRPRVQMRVKQTVETGCPYEAEYRIVNNGGTCSVIARGTGERDQAGKVVRLHGVILDTTPLKHARESLQRSSERLRLLSETVSALLRNPDPQSVVQHLCDDVRRFLKCEVFFNFLLEPGTNRLKLNACGGVDPRIARKVESLELGQSLCGTAAKDACRVVAEQIPSKPDPRSMLVSSLGVRAYACHPLMDQQGGVIGTLSFGATDRDRFAEEDLALMKSVADHVAVAMLRCRTEESLREAVADYQQQVQLFEGVASTTLDFVYIFDRQGRFVYANRRLLEVWGMQLPDIIGKTCRELGYEQWHHDMHMREIEKVIRTKAPIKGEVPFKAPLTGIFGVYEYIFTPVLGADGEVEVIAGTTRDVTQRKQFQSELERLVQERTVKLQEAVSELEHFSYSITHDMRAPLRAMRGFSEVLREAVGS